MAAPSSFRLPADVVAAWKEALSRQRAVKGVEPVLKDVLDVLLKEDTDGHVVVTRHQLFSWAQGLQGIALRGDATDLAPVADDMRSYLSGHAQGPPPAPAPPASALAPSPAIAASAFTSALGPAAAPAASRSGYVAPAPVTYTSAGAAATVSAGSAALRLVTERDVHATVSQLIRDARSEIVIVAPWSVGLDTLAKELLSLSPQVTLRILSRRPPTDETEYQRVMQELRRRNADVVLSNMLHTRVIIVDGQKALVGAAGLVPGSREVALLTADAAVVTATREAIVKLMTDARGR